MTHRATLKGHTHVSPAAFAAALLVAISALLAPPQARAQQVAVIVNGEPITTYDIDQRSRLVTLTTHKTLPRQETIEDLINDKIKVQAGKRYKLEMTDQDIDSSYANMAQRMRMKPEQLTQQLQSQGVAAYTLKDRIRAEMVWQQLVRGKYQASLQVNDKQIENVLQSKNEEKDATGVEYTLRPILFVVARGSSSDAVAAKMKEAEALRAQFDSCGAGIPLARRMRDVAVRDQIIKTSGDLAPALREILDKVQVGKLTDPEVTPQGIQVFALCNRRATKVNSAAKQEAQNEIFGEKFKAQSSRFLAELRKQAMIEYKDGANAKTARDNPR